ncbi:NYN domain-containing protein [Rhizobium lemnae]|uniref:NYN domain-containing protein n=1 Tax=Rhizobium lemnae TaxID=1214924 RepID=A0ABV8E591_9HYPH|nr:NYN domain-containing protein [Rhizobium lemnae]MCJ8507944.1 NYN domain-containing protein [Rhizobium lemnae]
MDCIILVDNSNIFIEGQKASAFRKGQLPAEAGGKRPADPSWRIDFAKLLKVLANGRNIHAAFLVGSRPPPKDDVWEMAKNGGFEVITHDRDSQNKEKAVDTELVAQGTLAVATGPNTGVLVIASGDRDFIPLVNIAHKRGWTVEMAAFQSAFTDGGEMATTVDMTRPLDGSLDLIGHNAYKWPA